ncbi:MAG: DUF4430 domain-containing protein [Bacillota bacterium]|nr:DUF4430 domain-containing protein [Bacillota bacterium]
MRIKFRKFIAVVLATAIVVFCVTACGSQNEANSGTDKVTFSISCANLLDEGNRSQLPKEKYDLVPGDGWILKPVEVSIKDGEAVFDVLLRVCKENKIHMEYEDTPLYDSAYIEGIANLYEFDGGNLSGWMYSVNGVFPNYGCSKIYVHDGDVVEWVYTCDLGADVGNPYEK